MATQPTTNDNAQRVLTEPHDLLEFVESMLIGETRGACYDLNGWSYGYTTQRLPNGKFAAVVMQGNLPRRVVLFSKRRSAKAQAQRWYQQADQRAVKRLPASMLNSFNHADLARTERDRPKGRLYEKVLDDDGELSSLRELLA